MFLAAPIRIALAVTAFALAGGVQAQVYKCKVDGKTTFSDLPCATDAKPINVRPASGHSGAVAPVPTAAPAASAPINSSSNPQAVVAKMERDRALRDIGHDIEIEHSKIREEEESMSRELAALRQKAVRQQQPGRRGLGTKHQRRNGRRRGRLRAKDTKPPRAG